MSYRQISFAFAAYIILLAARDIIAESRYTHIPRPVILSHLFVVIFSLSLLVLFARLNWRTTYSKLKNPRDFRLSLVVSLLTLVIYSVTFYLIHTDIMGAGLFNMIDFGLNPIFLSVIAVWYFKEHPRAYVKWAFLIFAVGTTLMFSQREPHGVLWIPVALIGTMAMAVSDSLCKHMLGRRGFEKPEVILIRFALPCAAALFYIIVFDWHMDPRLSVELAAYAALLGFLPLYVLYHVLGRANLSHLATWEIMLPLLVYIGTAHLHPADFEWPPWPILGAALVMVAFFLCEYRPRQTQEKIDVA